MKKLLAALVAGAFVMAQAPAVLAADPKAAPKAEEKKADPKAAPAKADAKAAPAKADAKAADAAKPAAEPKKKKGGC